MWHTTKGQFLKNVSLIESHRDCSLKKIVLLRDGAVALWWTILPEKALKKLCKQRNGQAKNWALDSREVMERENKRMEDKKMIIEGSKQVEVGLLKV